MTYWLVKTEPETWSWEMQEQKGKTNWDGVRNYQAQNNLKQMKVGDLALFYHSGKERAVVGIVRVCGPAVPDPSDEAGKFIMVPMETASVFPQPVTLAQIKAHPDLQHLHLIRQSRLSVMPIDNAAWKVICEMGNQEDTSK